MFHFPHTILCCIKKCYDDISETFATFFKSLQSSVCSVLKIKINCRISFSCSEVICKNLFWKIWANSQGNTCTIVSFLTKLRASVQFYQKRDSDTGIDLLIFWNFAFLNFEFLIEHLNTAASHSTKKWSFPFRISSVNVRKSEEILILRNAEEILMENFIFHAVSAVFLVTEIFCENLVTNRWTHFTPMFYFYTPPSPSLKTSETNGFLTLPEGIEMDY